MVVKTRAKVQQIKGYKKVTFILSVNSVKKISANPFQCQLIFGSTQIPDKLRSCYIP